MSRCQGETAAQRQIQLHPPKCRLPALIPGPVAAGETLGEAGDGAGVLWRDLGAPGQGVGEGLGISPTLQWGALADHRRSRSLREGAEPGAQWCPGVCCPHRGLRSPSDLPHDL